MAKGEVAVRSDEYATFDEFLAAVEHEFGVKVTDSAIYSGGEVVEKSELVGVPFVVMDWETHQSTTQTRLDEDNMIRPAEFAVVKVRTQRGPVIFTDGGTGILPVLEGHLEATGSKAGLLSKRGLRASEYVKKLDNGTTTDAVTYYFS